MPATHKNNAEHVARLLDACVMQVSQDGAVSVLERAIVSVLSDSGSQGSRDRAAVLSLLLFWYERFGNNTNTQQLELPYPHTGQGMSMNLADLLCVARPALRNLFSPLVGSFALTPMAFLGLW